MGARGPVPAAGKARAQASTDRPKAPTGTHKEIRKLFNMIAKANPHLTGGDSAMLLTYAQAVFLQNLAIDNLIADGIWIYDTTHGDGSEKRRHPSVITWRTAAEQARQAARALGVTPLDRARVVQPDDGDVGSLAEMLFQSSVVVDG